MSLPARDVSALRTAELLAVVLVAQEERAMVQSVARPLLYGRRIGAAAVRMGRSCCEPRCSALRALHQALALEPPACCNDGVLVQLARRLGPHQVAQRVELLMRVFANAMQASKTPYRRELALVEIAAVCRFHFIVSLLTFHAVTDWVAQIVVFRGHPA